ncbi:hypothetical protein ACS0TY_019068 [Phlomoides rotata]
MPQPMDIFALVFSLAIILLTLTFISRRRGDGSAKLPPGSYGWPIVGETIDFLFRRPDNFVTDRMRKYSPEIFKTKILGEKTAVLCGPKGHKFLFSNEQKYFTTFRPHPMQHIFRSYQNKAPPPPPESQRSDESKMIRKPGFFKPEALMRYLPKMDLITQQQIQSHCAGKNAIEVYPLAKTLTLSLACHFFLGIENPERISRLVKHFDDVSVGMHSMMLNFPGTVFYRANQAAAAIRKELITVVREKKQEMASGEHQMLDILSHLIVLSDANGKSCDEAEIADKIMGLLTAGYSTVATAITFVMKYIGLSSEIYEKVRAEQMEIAGSKKAGETLEWEDISKMKYSWNVVLETLRLVPPLQGTFREVVTEFTYAGYTIPKGWKVYWTVSTTNMNPEYFKNPEKFNPSRFDEDEAAPPFASVPFGGGPRTCPGKEYARLAILAFIHNVVNKYKWEVVDPNEKVEGDMMPEPRKGLPIRLYPH